MDYNAGSSEVPEGWTELEIASAGQRLVGWAVDFFIWVLVGIVACGLGLLVGGFALEEDSFLALNEEVFVMVAVLVLLGYVVVYMAMVGMSGQSPGKKLVGVKIVRVDGQALGFGGMVVREVVGKMIPGVIPLLNMVWLLSYVWILFDNKRQGWHDKIAGTVVVNVDGD